MNKGITLLVLVAVLGAMGLVLYSHSGSPRAPGQDESAASPAPPAPPPLALDGPASPLQNLQGESQGLRPIEPPISASRAETPPQGAPVPVTLSPDGRQARPAAEPDPAAGQSPAPRQEKTPPTPPARADKGEQEKKPVPQPREKPQSPPAQAGQPPREQGPGPSAAPGLEPWTVPPPEAAQAAAPPPAPAEAATLPPPAGTAPVATPPPVLAEQRLATDPIRPVQPAAGLSHNLAGISLVPAGQGMRLRIEADSAFTCKTFVLTGPDRLVVDLPGDWKGMKAPTVPQNNLIRHARLGQQPGGPRLVLDLNGPLKQHRTERSGAVVDVLLN